MSLAFRPMTATDFTNLVRWMASDHAKPWFDGEPATVEEARQRFGPHVDGTDRSVRMWVVSLDGRDIGYLQDYRVDHDDDYAVRVQDPTAAAFDYLIGEPDLIDKGIGTEMIGKFCTEILVNLHPDAPRFLASPDHRNTRSIRVLEKLGFTQGLWITHNDMPHPEIVCSAPRGLFEV